MFFSILVFLLCLSGLFLIFNINPISWLSKKIQEHIERPQSIKKIHNKVIGKKSKHKVIALIYDAKKMLDDTERGDQFSVYCQMSALLLTIGIVIGILCINPLLSAILGLAGALIPVLLVRHSTVAYTKAINSEYESALSTINSSYMRTENLTVSIRENLEYINPPVYQIFKKYLTQVTLMGFSPERALIEMRESVKNDVFKEWCNGMIQCQSDHTMKDMLDPIVSKLTEIASAQTELDAKLYRPVQETVAVMILIVAVIPIMYFLNSAWFFALFTTISGKLGLSFVAAAELFAIVRCIQVTRPLEDVKEAKS